jgi:hypothetical protein
MHDKTLHIGFFLDSTKFIKFFINEKFDFLYDGVKFSNS